MKVDSLDDLIERYGFPHKWDSYVRFINKWRLVAESIEIRVIIDVALRCPDKKFAKMSRAKFGKDFDLKRLDREWPGHGAFTYDWEGLARIARAKGVK